MKSNEIDFELMKTLENLGHSDLLERYWNLLSTEESKKINSTVSTLQLEGNNQ